MNPTQRLNNNNNNKNKARRSRNVRFANRTKVYLALHLNDYTQKEVSKTWTTAEDTKANQADVVAAVRSMRNGANKLNKKESNQDDQQICTRGLEAMASVQQLQELRTNKARVIDAVLDEQDRQWDERINDETLIAKASALNSKQAQGKAIVLAAADAAAVRLLEAEDKKERAHHNNKKSQQSLTAFKGQSEPVHAKKQQLSMTQRFFEAPKISSHLSRYE